MAARRCAVIAVAEEDHACMARAAGALGFGPSCEAPRPPQPHPSTVFCAARFTRAQDSAAVEYDAKISTGSCGYGDIDPKLWWASANASPLHVAAACARHADGDAAAAHAWGRNWHAATQRAWGMHPPC